MATSPIWNATRLTTFPPILMSFSLRLVSDQSFAANAVRLQLHALAYNLGNFLRTPEPIKPASGRLKGSSPFDGSLRPDEPPDAGAAQAAPGAPPAAGARSATGACAREGRAIPWRQLPRMRQGRSTSGSAPIEACCKADGLRFVLDVT
jgi:hypothetical protein